jgi:hypothetical protein
MSYAKLNKSSLALGYVFPITFLAIMASIASTGKAAAAPGAELAIKCRDIMIKAYPPVRDPEAPMEPRRRSGSIFKHPLPETAKWKIHDRPRTRTAC